MISDHLDGTRLTGGGCEEEVTVDEHIQVPMPAVTLF